MNRLIDGKTFGDAAEIEQHGLGEKNSIVWKQFERLPVAPLGCRTYRVWQQTGLDQQRRDANVEQTIT